MKELKLNRRVGSPRPNAGEGLGVRGITKVERVGAALSRRFRQFVLLVFAS